MADIETHPFISFVPDNASVLIIGSFPGREQTQNTNEKGWFYGAKRNQFWSILSSVYNEELITNESKQALFTKYGIAVTDVFLKVRRNNNSNLDDNLEIIETNEKVIQDIIEQQHIKAIFFTSKFVQKHFLKLFPHLTSGICLPSPSPRFARITKAEKIEIYKRMLIG